VSIRLRMTLLYSTILALTLIAFSTVLYVTQARYTLNIVKRDLDSNARQVMIAWTRFQKAWDAPGMPPRQAPMSPDVSYSEQAQQALQPLVRGELARDSVHLLDAGGEALAVGINEQSPTLPISADGLAELQAGKAWMEISQGEKSRWLIFNLPVVTSVTTNADGSTTPHVIGIVQLARSLADRDRSLHSMGITLIVGSLTTTVLAFGAGWLLAGTTLKPIQKITETAQEIGQSQDFSSRVEHDGPNDELGRLATTINNMLARLQGAYEQLAHALEVQRDFVADVSHELRTPLTTVHGNLALLKHDPPLPADEQGEILDDLLAESGRLSRLVNDLLTLARADAGHQLPVAPLEVDDVVDDVCRQANLLAPDREISCDFQAPSPSVANEDALRQVLLILMDNALKHGEGPIRVTTQERDHRVFISVQDSGPGMPEDLQGRIFDRFYRGDTSRSTPGFGLGLSIARSLIEAQDGTISMDSRCGVGSTFVIELPTAEQDVVSDE
jgi:two-component system, OmpR family, sensor kinase